MSHLLKIAVFGVVLVSSAEAFDVRDRMWTDYKGNKVKARFLTITEGMVRMRQDRKPIAIPFHELCLEDRDFIRDELNDRGEGHLIPTIGELREWTYGEETFEGRFVGPLKEDIILLRNERPETLSFARFSKEDQDYVRRALTSKGQAHLVPQARSESGGAGAGAGTVSTFGPGRFGGGYGAGGAGPLGGHAAGGAFGGTMPAASGSVPTYRPGGSSTTPSYSANSGAQPGAITPAAGHGASTGGTPSYNPFAGASVPSWNDPHQETQDQVERSLANLRIPTPSVPNFQPPSVPTVEFYKYCSRCKKRYPMSAEYCTDCSGGVRWRRYSVFGAIIGAVCAIGGAVIRAIRS